MYLRPTFILIVSILNALHCIATLSAQDGLQGASSEDQLKEEQVGNQEVSVRLPKDYAQSFTNSRVKDLVGFFELLQKSSEDPAILRDSNVILSLPESATKLHTLSHGQPLELKCDKYLKLLSRPNIRTVATISLLMKESRSFSEANQVDANLIAKLVNERSFDALARIQTILQSLESERTLGDSSFEPIVQKDLLDCVNYYIYRHQRATSEIVQHVRNLVEKLPKFAIESSKSEITLKKLSQAVDTVKAIESAPSNQFHYNDWLLELMNINKLAQESDYEIPEKVGAFLTDSKRAERLNLIDRGDSLKARLLKLESVESPELSEDYLAALRELQDVCREHNDIIPEETCALLQDSTRSKLIVENDHKESSMIPLDEHSASSTVTFEPAADVDHSSQELAKLPSFEEPQVSIETEPVRQDSSLSGITWLAAPVSELVDNREIKNNAMPDQGHHENYQSGSHGPPSDSITDTQSSSENEPILADSAQINSNGERLVQSESKNNRKKGRKRRGNKNININTIAEGPEPVTCITRLNEVRKYLVNYRQVNFKFLEVRRISHELNTFRDECLSDKFEEEKSLQASLRAWCRRNIELYRSKDCTTVLDVLD